MGERINTIQAAKILGISPSTLETLRSRKNQPQPEYSKIGRRVVYDSDVVEAFYRNCRVGMWGQK